MEFNFNNFNKWHDQYLTRIMKKIDGKAYPVRLLMYRTYNTATSVLGLIDGIPYEQLTMNVFFFCKDIGFQSIVREYDSQLELAGAAPDKFIFGLHSFYNSIVTKAKKGGGLPALFEFVSIVMRNKNKKRDALNNNLIFAYTNLVMQTLEYLRPDKFALESYICGISTSGELLTRINPYAFTDTPALAYEEAVYHGRSFPTKNDTFTFVAKEYKSIGFSVNSYYDMTEIEGYQLLIDDTVMALVPFINEYTYDILPQTFYTWPDPPLVRMHTSFEELNQLKENLHRRRNTLPSNGCQYIFSDPSGELTVALLKEIFRHDRVYLLYRLDTKHGSFAGYYDTTSDFFYSVLHSLEHQEAVSEAISKFESLILMLYASRVLDIEYLSTFPSRFSQGGQPLEVEMFDKGGRLVDVYHEGNQKSSTARDPEKYDTKEVRINGYIRRLPKGQTASQEAWETALKYGYQLGLDETYVRPFVKEVFVLKE